MGAWHKDRLVGWLLLAVETFNWVSQW
jgi:hypothetical protein